jgi:hypothetical protein
MLPLLGTICLWLAALAFVLLGVRYQRQPPPSTSNIGWHFTPIGKMDACFRKIMLWLCIGFLRFYLFIAGGIIFSMALSFPMVLLVHGKEI